MRTDSDCSLPHTRGIYAQVDSSDDYKNKPLSTQSSNSQVDFAGQGYDKAPIISSPCMRSSGHVKTTQALIMVPIVTNTKSGRLIDAHVPDSDLDKVEAADVTVKASVVAVVADTAALAAGPETRHTVAAEDVHHGRPGPDSVRSCSRLLCHHVGDHSPDRPAAEECLRMSAPRVSPSCRATSSLRDFQISCSKHDSIHMSSDDEVGGQASVVGHY